MKTAIVVLSILVLYQASAQVEVITTRPTHLLSVRNQAAFDLNLFIPAGGTVTLMEFYSDGYFKVRYDYKDHFIYYPYVSDVPRMGELRAELLNITNTAAPQQTHTVPRSGSSNQHVIHTGPRGGRYYINSKGNKVYVKD